MDDTTKTILIDVQLKADQLTQELPALAGNIASLKTQQAALRKEGKEGSMQFQRNAQDLRELSQQYREANKYIDNVAKARNAENNSIAQNRALLSALTADYVKLGQEQGKTSAATMAAGKVINDLTKKLKDQEKQIGQTYRNVGNYAQSIISAIPGVSKFSGVINKAVEGFSLFGKGAEEGAAGLEGLSAGATVAAGAFVVFAAGIMAVVSYLSQFAGYSDMAAGKMAKWKSVVNSIFTTIADGDWSNFISNMKTSGDMAELTTLKLKDLERQVGINNVLTQQEDSQIALNKKKMMDVTTTAQESERLYQETLKITRQQYERNHKTQVGVYEMSVLNQTAKSNLNDRELKSLLDLSKGYGQALVNAKKLTDQNRIDKDVLEGIEKAMGGIIAADNKKLQNDQILQNKNDRKQNKGVSQAEKEAAELERIKELTNQANSEHVASLARMLELKQEAFGKELSQADEHYRQLIFKQEQFISKQEAIIHNKKSSPRVKAAAQEAVNAGQSTITQLKSEQYIATEKMLIDHNRKMIDESAKAALALKQIQIAGIEDTQKREIASINNQTAEKIHALKVENDTIQDTLNKTNTEISDKEAQLVKERDENQKLVLSNELQALKTSLNAQEAALGVNADKVISYEKQKQKAIEDTLKKFADQKQAALDQVAILDAKRTDGGNSPFNSKKEAAEQQALQNEYNAAVSQAGLTEEAKLLIEKQYLDKSKELHKSYIKSQADAEIQAAQLVANTAFSIIENTNQRQDQADQVMLSKSKERELSNTSLTGAQKLAIEEKYRQKEGQAKVQEFKRDQKLNMAKAAIYGALSILKASPDPFQMALAAAATIAEEAIIINQQPPAYATGGLYQSDGNGALLRGPGTGTSDSINARLSNGEAIINAKSTSMFAPLLSAINEIGGGKSFSASNATGNFAVGGIFTDGGNANRYYAQPAQNNENLANTLAYQLINNFPPVIVDVKDINTQQAIKVQTTNRVNL